MELRFSVGVRRVAVAVVTDTNVVPLVFLSRKLLIWTICCQRFGAVDGCWSRGHTSANKHRICGIDR